MKKALIAIIAIGALSAAYFYVNRPQPQDVVITQTDTTAAAVVQPVAKPMVPVISPVVAKPAAEAKLSAAPALSNQQMAELATPPSPREELATTIPELVRLISAQDFETLMKDFMPPDELTALLAVDGQPGQPIALGDLAERMRQNPNFVQQMAGAAQFLTYLQTQTPTFDPGGQSANYPMPNPVNGQTSITFVKVGGYWYVKNGAMFFR